MPTVYVLLALACAKPFGGVKHRRIAKAKPSRFKFTTGDHVLSIQAMRLEERTGIRDSIETRWLRRQSSISRAERSKPGPARLVAKQKGQCFICVFCPNSVATLKGGSYGNEQLRPNVQSRWYWKRPAFSL